MVPAYGVPVGGALVAPWGGPQGPVTGVTAPCAAPSFAPPCASFQGFMPVSGSFHGGSLHGVPTSGSFQFVNGPFHGGLQTSGSFHGSPFSGGASGSGSFRLVQPLVAAPSPIYSHMAPRHGKVSQPVQSSSFTATLPTTAQPGLTHGVHASTPLPSVVPQQLAHGAMPHGGSFAACEGAQVSVPFAAQACWNSLEVARATNGAEFPAPPRKKKSMFCC